MYNMDRSIGGTHPFREKLNDEMEKHSKNGKCQWRGEHINIIYNFGTLLNNWSIGYLGKMWSKFA
jgi:hypothetical protein